MKKPKNPNKKLLAVLLSMAMIATLMPQGLQVHAAEASEVVQETLEPEEEAQESVSLNEEAAVEDSATTEPDEMAVTEEETGENRFSGEETGVDHASSEAVDENGSDDVMTEEELSTEETSSEEMAAEEESSGEEEADEESLKTVARMASTAKASGFSRVGGWNESIYAEISGVEDTDVTAVSYSGAVNGELSENDLNYLVRKNGSGVRIDVPGLKEGTYTLTVKVGQESVLTESGIKVYAYDRSGFAHFKYSNGVGAYKDDGTLKDNAVVLYVTDKNKNDVELKVGNITVKGIGNILNSVGQDTGGGKTGNGGNPNTNQGIIKELAKAGRPLVVRFIGTVSDSGLYGIRTFSAASECLIEGLTTYNSVDNGGSGGDNGHMARIQSGKDITLEGIGYDAVIDGWGFHYIAQSSDTNFGKSFEVRNLTFINTPEDAIGMEGQQASKDTSSDITASVERCWVHHNEFYCPDITSPAESDKSEGDGSVDFKRGQYFTCSYNYFDSCHKTNLVGSADYSLQYNLSYHHNYWYMCKARGPLTRNANVHMYNNVFDMQTDYAMNVRANAYIFSEYNLFYACKSPQAVESGAIKSYQDSIASVIWNKGDPGTVVENKSDYVPNNCQFSARGIQYDKFDTDASQSYIPGNDYQLQTDFEDMRKVIVSQTGVQEKNPKRPDAVSKSEYSVIGRMAGDNIHKLGSLPQTLMPGKISKSVYAFEVGAAFDLEITYENVGKGVGVLLNEEGENLLIGSGSALDLPAGRYMIQAENFQPGDPKKGTIAVFKEMTISSLKVSQHDPAAHYHKWKLDASKSTAATCTDAGKNVYLCEGTGTCTENGGIREETVAALGHNYKWIIDKPATAEETGLRHQECTRCHDKTNMDTEIPAGSSGGGSGSDDSSGGSTAAGDYELYFTGKKNNGDTDFFTVANGNYADKKGPVTVNGTAYTECLKIESKTGLSFSCNDGATLFMAFDGAGKKINIDGKPYTTDSNGTLTVENLTSGLHNITKGDSMNLFYVSVANGASSEASYTLSFEYNYDDSPDAVTVQAIEGKAYASMTELVPSSFSRNGYAISGLYTDADCTNPVVYPYVVNGNAIFYADWEKSIDDEAAYSLIFNSNGGSAVTTVRISSSQIYEITQKPSKDGYAFAGWYDAPEGGNLVDKIDGSKLTGNVTVYAHWNALGKVNLSLDCSELAEGDIKEKTNLNNSGFIAYALEGGVGTAGNENPKYYMTVKDGGLYTNGLRLTDTSIPGNEDGLLKTIAFQTDGAGVLSVETALSGQPAADGTYELVLIKKTTNGYEEVGRSAITTGTAKTTKEFALSEAGTYYLYAEGDKGVVYYSLKVTGQPERHHGIYIVGLKEKYEYTGAKIIPNIGVMDYDVEGGRLLAPGADYTVKYKDNTKPGLATVTVTGKGNYEGKDAERTFTIEEVTTFTELEDLKGVKLASIAAMPYTGEEQHPDFTLIKGGIPVPYVYDSEACVYKSGETAIKANVALSNNVNKGTATILISGADNGKGKPTKIKGTFKITAIDLQAEKSKVRVEADAGAYAVKGAVPASITVTYDGRQLINGTDYTVKYSANKKAGQKGNVAITGKGNYAKKCTAQYDIYQLNLAERKVEAVNAYDGIKAGKVTAIVTDNNGDALKPAQYTLRIYKNDALCDSADVLNKDDVIYVEAAAKDNDVNLVGKTAKEMFTVGSSIARAKVMLNKGENGKTITKPYTGSPVVLEASDLKVTIKENGKINTLDMGTDYEIASYTNNTNKGTAVAVIQGIGSYSGTKTVKFKITGKPIKITESTTWDDASDSIKNFMKGLIQ